MNVVFLRHLAFGNNVLVLRCSLKTLAAGLQYLPPPNYDFFRSGYNALRYYDRGHHRFNENSKVVCVEGPIGVGKDKLAKKIANSLGLLHVKDVDDEFMFILKQFSSPIDVRKQNDILPDQAKYYTTNMFWQDKDPIHKGKGLLLQYLYYCHRYYNYAKGMSYLFNTGRGFVSNRSPHSDRVFAKAFYESGLMSKKAYDFYEYHYKTTIYDLWKPHLIVYLKVSPSLHAKILSQRTVEWEKKGCNFNEKVFKAIAEVFEKDYLPNMKKFSEVLVVPLDELDLDNEEDSDYVIEQMTHFDLDGEYLEDNDKKFLQWRDNTHNSECIDYFRHLWSDCGHSVLRSIGAVRLPLDISECSYSQEAREMREHLFYRHPAFEYDETFDPKQRSMTSIMFSPNGPPMNFQVNPLETLVLAM